MERFRWRRAALRSVTLCESCAEVCTAECRSQARIDRTRTWTATQTQAYPFIR